MLPMGPSVDSGNRGSTGNTTRTDHYNHGGYWDPLVRGFGPVNVFNDEVINTDAQQLDQAESHSRINNDERNISNQIDRNNNRNNNNNNKDEERRNKDQRHNNNQSSRDLSRQQRGSPWAQSTADMSFRDQSKQFNKGRAKYRKKATPSNKQLISYVNKKSSRKMRRNLRGKIEATAMEICNQQSKAGQHVRQMVQEYMHKRKYGDVPKAKPDHCIRILLGQFNSLGIFTGMTKVHQLNNIINDFGIDIMGGSETQADWRFVKEEHRFGNLFGRGRPTRSVAANNTAEPKMRRDQKGGTGMVAFGRVSTFVRESPKDPSNLGRFCSMLLSGGGKKTRFVQLYVPGDPGRNSKGFTVWDQQCRVWEKKEICAALESFCLSRL